MRHQHTHTHIKSTRKKHFGLMLIKRGCQIGLFIQRLQTLLKNVPRKDVHQPKAKQKKIGAELK